MYAILYFDLEKWSKSSVAQPVVPEVDAGGGSPWDAGGDAGGSDVWLPPFPHAASANNITSTINSAMIFFILSFLSERQILVDFLLLPWSHYSLRYQTASSFFYFLLCLFGLLAAPVSW